MSRTEPEVSFQGWRFEGNVKKMDFVPTLCALGTIGIGPAGLALGYEEQDTIPRPTSGKRKAPRSGMPSRPFSTPLMRTADYSTPNTTQSEPLKLEPNYDQPRASTSHGTSLKPAFWRRMSASSSPFQNSTPSISRQSSVGARRSLMLRADHDASPSAESNDLENLKRSSSWLKRISTISSLNGSPSSSVRPTTPSVSFSNNSATPFLASGGPSTLPPNKLVKRTSSHRAISANHAKAPQLRRPATSHQRSATFGNMTAEELSRHGTPEPHLSFSEHCGSSSTPPVWRPYFSSGYGRLNASQPRKRHTSGSGRADSIRPVQKISNRHPILVSAKSVESRPSQDDIDDVDVRNMSNGYMVDIDEQHDADDSKVTASHIPKKKHRSRHSFSVSDMFGSSSPTASKTSAAKSKSGSVQRRRGMTEPPPGKSDATGLDRTKASPLSPISNVSTFDIDLPRGTPTFPLHPNFDARSESSSVPRFPSSSNAMLSNRNKRVSLAPSDPASTTFGSDYDQRVFSSGDEDSVDFQSDTAYDSLATRATASSHSGLRKPDIETIFDESPPRQTSKNLVALEDLMGGGTLDGLAINMELNRKGPMARSTVQEQLFNSSSPRQPSSVSREDGYEPDEEETEDSMEEVHHVSTPVRTQTFEEDDFITTPMPKRHESAQVDVCSPASSVQCNSQVQGKENIRMSIEAMSIDESEWDKTTDPESTFNESMKLPGFPRHIPRRITPPPFRIHQDSADGMDVDSMDWHAEQRLSIFDWSEQQKSDRDLLNGSSPRPRTMHGKQSLENRGSRSSGRRGLSALHLRSQSVPVARESMMENDPHFPATKFGTWGLGNKGVSEEWNDDFEFDDLDNGDDKELGGLPLNAIPSQGMRVPQSIIDRQASVHGQFGQVQEFMLLVEELKRLRIHGAALNLLEGPSGHMWDDAENIINLATLNDDDDDLRPPNSPASPSAFDDFDEQSPPLSRARKQSDIHSDDNGYLEPVPRRSISSAATPPSGRPRGDSLAQVKSFLQTIQQSRNGPDSSPAEIEKYQQKKLPFDTRDLRELVSRASTVTRALKDIVRKAEGVSVSPDKTPKKVSDPAFSQIFHRVEESPSPSPSPPSSLRKPSLPKSRSAHGYLGSSMNGGSTTQNDLSGRMKMMTVV